MSELSSIPLSQGELLLRISLVANGYPVDKVSDLLGGSPYEREVEGEKLRAFWRFRVLEREGCDPYEILSRGVREPPISVRIHPAPWLDSKGKRDEGMSNDY